MRVRVQCAFVQETRWRGNNPRSIGQGYQLVYTGSPTGKNDIAVVFSGELRKDLRVLIDGELLPARAYAAQAGCSVAEKEYFWENLEELLRAIPTPKGYLLWGT